MPITRDISVIDADTHVVEPYDLWTSRVSVQRWGDRVPHVVWSEKMEADVWVAGNEFLGLAAGIATAGFEQAPPDLPKRWDQLKPEVWRAEDRLDLMTRYGIHAAVLYPNVSGFGAGRFVNMAGSDPDLALSVIKAYNDYVAEFCQTDPSRFVAVMAVPFWDIEVALAEMERAARLAHKGIIFSQQPELYGQPTLAARHWDPIWAAAQEMQLPVNFHISSGASIDAQVIPPEAGVRANFAARPVLNFVNNCQAITKMIAGGVCHRYPELRVVSVESGIGWIPFALQSLDWMWENSGVAKEHPEYDLLPSDYFRRQVYGCFWFEQGDTLRAALDFLGEDNVLYETDFPHPASMSPGPASQALSPKEFIERHLTSFDERTLQKVLHDNAADLYRLA
jgi:uncharacterized protein